MSLAIGVDVGGTKVAAGVVDEQGAVLARTRRATPGDSADEVEDAIADVVAELRETYRDVVAVGIGAAGFVDADQAVLMFAPHLAWRGEPLRDEVSRRVGLPVVVDNDANAMAWGEHRFGAGRGQDDLVALTVGTGIGGGIVLGGRPYRGHFGVAGEFGHMRVVPDGLACACGLHGCWEVYCSGPALVLSALRHGLEPMRAGRMVDGGVVHAAAVDGDPAAQAAFAEVGSWLGQGIADLVAVLDPGVVVVGGGVGDSGDLLLEPARRAFEAALSGHEHRPHATIVAAQLGSSAGLVGAADLARRH